MDLDRPVTRWRRENRPPSRAGNENDRPLSRRGNVNSGSIGSDRPRVIVRPPTGSVLYPSRSGSRLASAGMQPDRTMTVHSRRERLISQQGLGGLRTGTSKGQGSRQVQDKRYFHGLLKMKMGQLNTEIAKLKKQIEIDSREQASYLAYDKRVKEMATELTEAQRKLADYNLVVDKLNTGGDIPKLIAETKELAAINDTEVTAVEMLFTDRLRRQEAVAQLELQINKENSKAENLISEMGPHMKEQYNELKEKNANLGHELDSLKTQLDSLNNSKASLNEKLFLSLVKREAIRLELKLWELEEKRDRLLLEQKSISSPTKERNSLLMKVKEDNAQMASMERAIIEIQERIKQTNDFLMQQEQAKSHISRNVKYFELKKREQSMEEFLATVEISKKEELEKLSALEIEVVAVLKKISSKLSFLPTAADYKSLEHFSSEMKMDVLNTTKSLNAEHKTLSLFLYKVELMDKKVKSELANFKSKISKMKNEMETFSNIEGLQQSIAEKERNLTNKRDELLQSKPALMTALKNASSKYNQLQQQLVENETNAQLVYLERKLSAIEQNNFAVLDYLGSSIQEEEIDSFRSSAIDVMKRLNDAVKNYLNSN